MINAAPNNASTSPRQKAGVNFCFRISQAPKATHSGAVFPSRVAFEAVVYEREAVHSPKSQAVNIPASKGNTMDRDWTDGFVFTRGAKNGSNKNMEKNRR